MVKINNYVLINGKRAPMTEDLRKQIAVSMKKTAIEVQGGKVIKKETKK
jgi:hypothetical protein